MPPRLFYHPNILSVLYGFCVTKKCTYCLSLGCHNIPLCYPILESSGSNSKFENAFAFSTDASVLQKLGDVADVAALKGCCGAEQPLAENPCLILWGCYFVRGLQREIKSYREKQEKEPVVLSKNDFWISLTWNVSL